MSGSFLFANEQGPRRTRKEKGIVCVDLGRKLCELGTLKLWNIESVGRDSPSKNSYFGSWKSPTYITRNG